MELRQRKRIANLPRFNYGVGSAGSTLKSYLISQSDYGNIDTKVGVAPSQQGVANDLLSYVGSNAPVGAAIAGGGIKQSLFQNPPSDYTKSSNKSVTMSTVGNTIANAFDQSSKFDNKTANDIKNYGGAISKLIPGKYGEVAGGLVDITADTIGMYNYKHTGDEMRNEAGTGTATINGINYNTQNALDTGSTYNDVKSTGVKNAISSTGKGVAMGTALGSVIPGLGNVVGGVVGGVLGLAGGLFGGRAAAIRQKRINRNAAMQTQMLNQDQMAQADTEGLQNKYYQNHYDTTGTVLYANRGKDLRQRKRLINKTKV